MFDLSLINGKISSILREENNEVVYRSWLFVTEEAKLQDNNLVLAAPNYYAKNCIEERYLSDIEALYREDLEFDKIIVAVDTVPTMEKLNSAVEMAPTSPCIHDLDHFIEKINDHVKEIYELIETTSKNGFSSTSFILAEEPNHSEEIYWQVKDFMLNKGFKAELNKLDRSYALDLSWD